MANILLVATGGTRAPTQIELAEHFLRDGHAVRLVASHNALRFLGSHIARRPEKLRSYLRHYRPALRETLAYFAEKPREVPHIAEGKWADVAVMAPATCNSVGKLAAGVSDNYPLLVLRAVPRTKRVIVVPSMNPEMWYDPLFQRNIDLLNATEKYRVLCPSRGQMLSGDWGIGAQVPIPDIITEVYRVLGLLGPDEDALVGGVRAGAVPWAEEEPTPGAARRVLLVEPEPALRDQLVAALRREYPGLDVQALPSASQALEWLRTNRASAVFTELDFPDGASGLDLIQHLRRPGLEEVPVVAASRRTRQEVGAERLARLEVLFAPKPLNVPFIVGMIAGTLRPGARQAAMTTRRLAPGEVLFRQGERGGEIYLVRAGRLRLEQQAGDEVCQLGFAEVGEMLGERTLIDHGPRACTATAVEQAEVGVLDPEGMRAYLDGQPPWVRAMLASLVGHLRETTDQLVAERASRAEN